MTQFQPPQPPDFNSPNEPMPHPGTAATPWSGVAVTGFVASLLGCTVVGAVIGLALGVWGIVATSGGQRRGRGLAIAAIPISLISGVIGVMIGFGTLFMSRMNDLREDVILVMGAEAVRGDTGAEALFAMATADLAEQVTKESVQAWLARISDKHGALVSIQFNQTKPVDTTPEGEVTTNFDAKFVNGTAVVTLRIDPETVWSPKITDIEVDGESLLHSQPE